MKLLRINIVIVTGHFYIKSYHHHHRGFVWMNDCIRTLVYGPVPWPCTDFWHAYVCIYHVHKCAYGAYKKHHPILDPFWPGLLLILDPFGPFLYAWHAHCTCRFWHVHVTHMHMFAHTYGHPFIIQPSLGIVPRPPSVHSYHAGRASCGIIPKKNPSDNISISLFLK